MRIAGTEAGSPPFDAYAEYRTFEHDQPHRGWSTAALIRGAEELLLASPWGGDPFRRSIWLTSLLARLGERGIPADAVVRSCLSGQLTRRIVFEAATAWFALVNREVTKDAFPDEVVDWIEILETLIPPLEGDAATLTEILVEAQAGQFGQLVSRWIATTSVTHIIQWRVKGALVSTVHPADRVLAGGAEATRWIYDRFSKTYLSDWAASSLLWEISFSDAPQAVARDAGTPLTTLQEREVSMSDLLDQLRSRHLRQERVTNGLGGASVGELVEQILYLVRSRDFIQAQDLADALVAEFPSDPYLRNAYAFLQIPSNPESARLQFEDPSVSARFRTLSLVNIATCALVKGDIVGATRVIEDVRTSEDVSIQEAWLWDPNSLIEGNPAVTFMGFEDWIVVAEQAIASQAGPQEHS